VKGSPIEFSGVGPAGVGFITYAPVSAGGFLIAADDNGRLFALNSAGALA